jgi:transposase
MNEKVVLSRKEYDALLAELEAVKQAVALLQKQLLAKEEERAHLETANAQLQYQLNELKQKPFKRSKAKDKGSKPRKPKPRGRRKGHEGSGRKKPIRIDQTIRIEAGNHCPACGNAFSSTEVKRTRDVVDIEPIRPTLNTRYIIERGWCPKCRKYHESAVTDALPSHRFGLHLMLFVVYQKVALGLSYSKIQTELSLYFGLTISRGELSNIVAQVSRLFGPIYADLLRLMRQQMVLHIDETGWKVDGDNHWLWVFINDVVALFLLSKSRGSKVPAALLGKEFDGIIVSDFFTAYSPLEVNKAKCWAHLLRDSYELTKGRPPPDPSSERVLFHQELHQLYLAMGIALLEVEADETIREQRYTDMRSQLQKFAQKSWQDADCVRLAKRIDKYLDELVVWLVNPDVAPDNNAAERALRPAVVTRKTSFGSRSKMGAQAFARLLSVIISWGKQDISFFEQGEHILRNVACSQN